jgi:Domain of unknown function (DUF4440)
MKKRITLYFVISIVIICIAWTGPHQNQEIESAMNQYNRYILSMNTDSIASIFAPDGDLGDIAHGRDSIQHFLLRFKEFKVLSQKSTTNSISITGDSATQTGMYWQTTIIPPNDTVHVKGNFTAKWIWLGGSGWKIKRMDTQPVR